MALEDVLGKLDPKTRKRLILASEVENKKLRVPSVSMNLALMGGLGFGRQVMLWGNKSAGKSTFCQHQVGIAQDEGLTCAWIDSERSWDKDWAARLGVDNKNLIISTKKTVSGVTEDIVDFMQAGVDVIVVDSISFLLPDAYFSDKDELKEVKDSKQIGVLSRELGIAASHWAYANDNTLLILISQERNNIGTMHASKIPSGGEAIKFSSSTIIKLTSTTAVADQIKGETMVGDKIFTNDVGRPVTWNIQNNKQGPQNRTGKYSLYYDGDFVGIDNFGEIVELSAQMGVVEFSKPAWYNVYGKNIQGKEKAALYLRENPEVYKQLESELYAKI